MGRRAPDEPKESELTDTQRRILAAALEVFSEKGFAGASTAEIAVRAGVAEKTLFAQFKTKEGLLARTLTPAVVTLVEPKAIAGLQETISQPWERLDAFLAAFLSNRLGIAKRHPKMLKLVAHMALLRPAVADTLRATFRTHIGPRLAPTLQRLVAQGELRDLPPQTVLRIVLSVTIGYALSRYVLELEPKVNDAEEIARIVDVLVNGLRPRGEDAATSSGPATRARQEPQKR